MIKRILLGTSALLIALAPLAANAGEVQNRVKHEQARINGGLGSGELTAREYNHVDGRLDRINAARIHDLRANGGHLTAAEYRNLNRRENSLSNQIYFDKHNLRRQTGAPRV